MKSVTLLTALLVGISSATAASSPPATADGTITIATWNAMRLGTFSSVAAHATIIGKFDIVALQEITSREALTVLVAELNERMPTGGWDFVVSPLVGEGAAAEYYAFVYRADRIELANGVQGVYPEMTPEDFAREPFYATFRAKGGDFDFTLITVHVTWGDVASLRTAECHRLPYVWQFVQSLDLNQNDVILLGDLNRDKPTHGAFTPLWRIATPLPVGDSDTYTTYSTATDRVGANWYDYIWIDTAASMEDFAGAAGVYCPHEDYFTDTEYPHLTVRTELSDHCPVWAQFHVACDTDRSEAARDAAPVTIACVDPVGERIQLRNTTGERVDLGGYRLSDREGDYTISQGTWLAPWGTYDVLIETYNPAGNTRALFLNDKEDEVLLFAPGWPEPVAECVWGPRARPPCRCAP